MGPRCVVTDEVVQDPHVPIDCLQELLFVLLQLGLECCLSLGDFLFNHFLHLSFRALQELLELDFGILQGPFHFVLSVSEAFLVLSLRPNLLNHALFDLANLFIALLQLRLHERDFIAVLLEKLRHLDR